jgi:hypothetical protein
MLRLSSALAGFFRGSGAGMAHLYLGAATVSLITWNGTSPSRRLA